jgi:branched-chain amino acid transport system permease protein
MGVDDRHGGIVKDPIYFLLLGLGIGSLYAMIGAAMVTAFKGAGVIHFGLPAMAQYTLFSYYELRNTSAGFGGDIRLPWVNFIPKKIPITRGIHITLPHIPVQIRLHSQSVHKLVNGTSVVTKVSGSLSFVPAFLISMALAVLTGLMVHFLVFRPLRNAAPLGKVVAAIAVSGYFVGICQLNFHDLNNPEPTPLLPNQGIKNFLGLGLGPNVHAPRLYDRSNLWLALIAVAIGVGLYVIYRVTRFGIATRAAAGNEKGAVLLGYSPEFLAAANWVIASVVASFAAIIVADHAGAITPIQLESLVGAFLAAMLVGGLNSILLATLGGLALGMVETFSTSWLRAQHWFPISLRSGVKEALPLVVISLILFLRGKSLPIRGTIEQKRLPLVPYPRRAVQYTLILSTLAVLSAFFWRNFLDKTWGFALSTTIIYAIFGLSLVVIAGYVGQISLGNLALAGTAAFVMVRMTANGSLQGTNLAKITGPGLPWLPAMLIGVVASVLVGVILGLPALRVRGVQLAVVTIAAAELLRTMFFENDKATGLRAGVPGFVPRPTFFGAYLGAPGCNIPIGTEGKTCKSVGINPNLTIMCLVFLVACAWLVMNVRRSGTGRRFLSVRANERAAAAAGVNVPRTKLLGFAISAGLAGVAGCLIAFQQDSVASANFPYQALFPLLTFAYLAGITSINGAMLGSAASVGIIAFFNRWAFHSSNIDLYTPVIGGVAVIVTAVFNPQGQAVFFQPIMRYAGDWLIKARVKEWGSFVRRYVPWIIGGLIVGYLWWPARVHSYNKFWMPVIGAWFSVTLVRQISLGIYHKIRKRSVAAQSAAGSAQEAHA